MENNYNKWKDLILYLIFSFVSIVFLSSCGYLIWHFREFEILPLQSNSNWENIDDDEEEKSSEEYIHFYVVQPHVFKDSHRSDERKKIHSKHRYTHKSITIPNSGNHFRAPARVKSSIGGKGIFHK